MAAIFMLDILYRRRSKRRHSRNTDTGIADRDVKIKREHLNATSDNDRCRVCLKDGNIPIFQHSSSDNIAEHIRQFADIEVNEEDELPKLLCQVCHNLLQAAVLFRQQARDTDRRLRNPVELAKAASPEHYCDDFGDNEEGNWNDDADKEKEGPEFYCKKCQVEFADAKDYTEHRRTDAHKRARVPCAVCQASVASRYLSVHMARFHAAVQPFVCDVCGKSFPVKGSFKRHLQTHTDELPFKCDECPYRGRFRESLKLHMRVHTGEKPYSCDQCPAQFINASNLKKHGRTHQAHFDFKCEQCDRGFYTLLKLKEHFRVDHTGLKEHKCNICGKEFAYRKQMMKHSRKVHHRPKMRNGRLPLYLQIESKRRQQERGYEGAPGGENGPA